MSNQFSRRQIIRLGASLLAGATGATIFGKMAAAQSSILRGPRQRVVPGVLPKRPRMIDRVKSTFYTNGRHLYHPNGTKVILRGIDLPLLDDWGFPQSDKLAELEKTGANAVRIQWYANYGQAARPAYTIADLDNFLARCRTSQMIPIVYLSDLTCQSDPNLLNSQLIPWWTSTEVVAVLKKHQRYLIINLANELGHYRWTGNQPAALNSFKKAYQAAIASIRQTGLNVPIAIDAPDCGTSIEVFPAIAQALIDGDPARNLLFSGHAYWAGYNGIPHIQAAINANIPLFFGEIANKQDETVNGQTQYCYYDLDGSNTNRPAQNGFTYQALLPLLKEKEIGWLAWSWWKDNCAVRQMTSDGTFARLTPYGQDIVNHPSYGLKATASRVAL
jgi:mannan endo-1,4-beta-mannosidase